MLPLNIKIFGEEEVEKPDLRSKAFFKKIVKKILRLKEAFSKSELLLIKMGVFTIV